MARNKRENPIPKRYLITKIGGKLEDHYNTLRAAVDDMNGKFFNLLYYLDTAPTVDAVEVVRCKDCVYWDKNSFTPSSCDDVHWCSFKDLVEYGDWFCADGERRE